MTTAHLRVITTLFFIVVYALLLPWLGFFTTTGLYLITHMLYLGIRRLYLIAGVTLGVLTIFYILFASLLRIPLPHGWIY